MTPEEEQALYYAVDSSLSPFEGPVFISHSLSDRLEVPEEWQFNQSFNERAQTAMAKAAVALEKAPAGRSVVTFSTTVPSNITGQPELLTLMLSMTEGQFFLDFGKRSDA